MSSSLMAPPRVVVMGVSGCGKTTVGRELAARLGVSYADADGFHTAASISKMSAHVALDDTDREPWLRAIGRWLCTQPDGGVVGCSALKRRYRDVLRHEVHGVWFLHLSGPEQVARARVRQRSGHFMPPEVVHTQYEALEPLMTDEPGRTVDFTASVDRLVGAALTSLGRHSKEEDSDTTRIQ
ncbi:gluconokinase [Nocardioidaceae bacterium SCSIO 66511]|nr:gluconokinase [Nocardioidaceae bacterium SCSIO 66511]